MGREAAVVGASYGRVDRPGLRLVSAHDHRVDFVDSDGKDRPEYGRHEEAADDIDYGVGIEEAGNRASIGATSGEAL
jgi:hypothetical protein